jgi:hypothetical protein
LKAQARLDGLALPFVLMVLAGRALIMRTPPDGPLSAHPRELSVPGLREITRTARNHTVAGSPTANNSAVFGGSRKNSAPA